jgi:hypothetical protein
MTNSIIDFSNIRSKLHNLIKKFLCDKIEGEIAFHENNFKLDLPIFKEKRSLLRDKKLGVELNSCFSSSLILKETDDQDENVIKIVQTKSRNYKAFISSSLHPKIEKFKLNNFAGQKILLDFLMPICIPVSL